MKPAKRLNAVERGSAAWHVVLCELQRRLETYRAKNENPEVPESERLGLCWRINELKELLQLGEPEPLPAERPTTDGSNFD